MNAAGQIRHPIPGLVLALALFPSAGLAQEDGSTADQVRLLADSVALLRSLDRSAGHLPEIAAALNGLRQQLDRLLRSDWEYHLLQINRFNDTGEQLDFLGRNGWELVGVSPDEGFVFKRRIPQVRRR